MSNTIPLDTKRFSLTKHGLRVDFDASEIFPDDPGAGTPVLVWLHGESGTYSCVREVGEVCGDDAVYLLTQQQIDWLWQIEDRVILWMQHHTPTR